MKRKTLFVAVAAIILVAAVGFIGYQKLFAGSLKSSAAVQTVTVKRGSLVATVSASGNVSAPGQVSLAFPSSGRVAAVNVKVGDAVKQGESLMALDTTDLNLALKTAQSNLSSAQINYNQTKADLDFALRTAQANLTSSKASLDAAQAENAQNPQSLIIAKAALNEAQVALQKAQVDYDAVAWRPDVGMTSQAVALQQATDAYQSALATYKKTAASINDAALIQAQASYANAQTALEQAQKNMDTKLAAAQVTLDNAQVALDQAQQDLDNAKLVATMDGIVSAVNYGIGDTASGTAVTIVDLSKLQVTVTISEVDIAKLKVGQTAEMTLDALSGKTYQAQVMTVSPVGTVTSGVVNYTVTLALANADGSIMPGMTSSLDIQVDRRDNVLMLPTRAVKTQGNQKVVTVQVNGKSTAKAVNTGLSNDSYIEITNGLQEGEVVVMNQTTTSTSANAGGGVGGLGIMDMGAGGPPPGAP